MPVERDQVKTVVIVAVVLIGFGIGIWWPAHAQRAGLQARIDRVRAELGIDPDSQRGVRDWYAQVTALRERVSGAQRYVPAEDELADVHRSLTQALNAFDVIEPEVLTGEITHYDDYSTIPVNLRFRGSYAAARGVLEQIESTPRLMRIDRLDVESDGEQLTGRVIVRLELATFFSPQAARVALEAAP